LKVLEAVALLDYVGSKHQNEWLTRALDVCYDNAEYCPIVI